MLPEMVNHVFNMYFLPNLKTVGGKSRKRKCQKRRGKKIKILKMVVVNLGQNNIYDLFL